MRWDRLVFPRRERIELYHTLATLLASGVQLPEALESVGRQEAQHRGVAGHLRQRALNAMARSIRGGRPDLAFEAMAPSAELLLLGRVAQLPGDEVFHAAARVAETGAAIQQAALQALAEPMAYLLALGAMLWGAGGHFLPPFMDAAPLADWPAFSRNMASLSLYVHGNAVWIAALSGACILLIASSVRWWVGPGRGTLDRVPPWSIYAIVQGAAFVLAVRSLAGMGIAIGPAAFQDLRRHASPWLRQKIGVLEHRMAAGAEFGEALAQADGFPSPRIATVAAALAGSRGFNAAFASASDRWLARVAVEVRAAAVALQYVFLTLVAAALVAMMQVMFSLFGVVA